GYGIALDDLGNVYSTGIFSLTGDFDPGPGTYNMTSKGSLDVFILKLDNGGNFVWAKQMGSTTNVDIGNGLDVDEAGNIYTVGFFWGTVDFDPEAGVHNETMVDYGDIFIHKMSQCQNITFNNIKAFSCIDY